MVMGQSDQNEILLVLLTQAGDVAATHPGVPFDHNDAT